MQKIYQGLTEKEVLNNQNQYGLNEIEKKKRKSFFIIFIQEFNDWLIIILLIAAFVGLIVDRNALFETFVIILILLLNVSRETFFTYNSCNHNNVSRETL